MENIIETKDLTKKFGRFTAADSISLSVKKGEIFGFLGLNGAGKTTTIRMLLGMIRPTSGESYLKGKKVHAGNLDLWKNVGYLVEIPYSYPELTVFENLEIIRRLRFISDSGATDSVIEKLHLGQYRNRKAKHLSLGNSQRLGLAKAIMHNPGILILDEPANGLDPAGIVEIRELILDLARNHGTTVFISSHILGEISKFATRIGIVHEGRLIQELNTDELETLRKRRLLVAVRDKECAMAFLTEKGFKTTIIENDILDITGKNSLDCPDRINALLVDSGNPPTMLKVETEDLETYFLRTVGKGTNDCCEKPANPTHPFIPSLEREGTARPREEKAAEGRGEFKPNQPSPDSPAVLEPHVMGLPASLWAEGLKVKRSKIFVILLIVFAFIAVMMGALMYVAQHPELAGRSASISAKTSAIGKADWPSYLSLLVQIVLAMGPIGFGMVTAWVFGREYSDRVIKDLLALPVSRTVIVVSKFIVILIWCIILAALLFITGILAGFAVGMPGWSFPAAIHAFAIFTGSFLLTMLLCTPVAFLASVSRGYLLPVGFAIFTLILTNFVAMGIPGIMPYFPWAIPALYSGIAGREALPHAGAISYFVLISTSVLGFLGTAAWWRFADQT